MMGSHVDPGSKWKFQQSLTLTNMFRLAYPTTIVIPSWRILNWVYNLCLVLDCPFLDGSALEDLDQFCSILIFLLLLLLLLYLLLSLLFPSGLSEW